MREREERPMDPHERRRSRIDRWRLPRPIELWRLRGAIDELRGLAIETSFGYAFGLELDTELVLLHLQRNLESMVAYSDRMESALIAQGWRVIHDRSGGRSLHVSG